MTHPPFTKVLIANRGAIACRIIRTLRRMGIQSVAVFSEADAGSRHVAEADEAVLIGPAAATESYLDFAKILAAARSTGAQAIHPGYGFLSENTAFAEACAAEGIVFIGPTPDNIRAFGLKHTARELAAAHGVPLAPGSGLLHDLAEATEAAARIGYPVILKATAGGGGIGMKVCHSEPELADAFAMVARLGAGNFGNGGVFCERYVARARRAISRFSTALKRSRSAIRSRCGSMPKTRRAISSRVRAGWSKWRFRPKTAAPCASMAGSKTAAWSLHGTIRCWRS